MLGYVVNTVTLLQSTQAVTFTDVRDLSPGLSSTGRCKEVSFWEYEESSGWLNMTQRCNGNSFSLLFVTYRLGCGSSLPFKVFQTPWSQSNVWVNTILATLAITYQNAHKQNPDWLDISAQIIGIPHVRKFRHENGTFLTRLALPAVVQELTCLALNWLEVRIPIGIMFHFFRLPNKIFRSLSHHYLDKKIDSKLLP